MQMSIGQNGEFFVSVETLDDSVIEVCDKLYRRIMEAKEETIIVSEARRRSEEDC